MEIKKVWAMYFSPTGGTEKAVRTVAADLAEHLGVPMEIYDFTLPDVRKQTAVFTETDLVCFGTPVIAGRVPNVLLPYLKTVVGGGAYGIPMVSFGNRNFDDALIELLLAFRWWDLPPEELAVTIPLLCDSDLERVRVQLRRRLDRTV